MKAFSVGTPVVTLPGAFARSRVATACYRKMQISECVATDTEDYVRIAHRLGCDREWNQHIRQRIRNARHVLFENTGVLRELEKFFAEVTAF
jgi:predicted O-linked N-acetylglucosamine transferase (SPINDLY family)